jgi:transcriptional regulator with XRE-family HTH domain
LTQSAVKQEFITKVNFLYEEKGITLVSIANSIGTSSQKLRDIRKGRSSGSIALLKKLNKAYENILNEGNQPSDKERLTQLESEFERIKKENQEMKDMIMRLQHEIITKNKK